MLGQLEQRCSSADGIIAYFRNSISTNFIIDSSLPKFRKKNQITQIVHKLQRQLLLQITSQNKQKKKPIINTFKVPLPSAYASKFYLNTMFIFVFCAHPSGVAKLNVIFENVSLVCLASTSYLFKLIQYSFKDSLAHQICIHHFKKLTAFCKYIIINCQHVYMFSIVASLFITKIT